MKVADVVMKYLHNLKNIPYNKTYEIPDPTIDETSYWINTSAPLPSKKTLTKYGINCSGLANLARRKVGLDIPGNIKGNRRYKFIGNTQSWFKYLSDNNRLELLDYNKKYPKGCLLIKKYTPTKDGHLGMLYDNNMNIIHSDPFEGKVCILKLPKNMFTHVCYPKNWLLKN